MPVFGIRSSVGVAKLVLAVDAGSGRCSCRKSFLRVLRPGLYINEPINSDGFHLGKDL